MTQIAIILGASKEASIVVDLYNNDFVKKWVSELQWCINNCSYNQTESLTSLYDLKTAGEILVTSCETVNRFINGFIDIRQDITDQPQDYFNYLHRKFEELNGSFTRPTRLFTIAPKELKDAIRNLNFFVHRVETKKEAYPSIYISFDKDQYRRKQLEVNDYEYFEFKFPAGTLFLNYVELGKEYIDLFEDQLPIDYDNLKNLHYYSGEAVLTFEEYDPFSNKRYFTWLQDNGIDPYNKHLGHGKIPLGIVDDIDKAKQTLLDNQYFNSVEIKE